MSALKGHLALLVYLGDQALSFGITVDNGHKSNWHINNWEECTSIGLMTSCAIQEVYSKFIDTKTIYGDIFFTL